jgi:hypothetical protein
MASKVETFKSSRYLYPLLNALRNLDGFSPWLGDDYVDKAITQLLQEARGRPVVSRDFEGFDASVPRVLHDAVNSLYTSWFIPTAKPELDVLREYAATAPIVVPGKFMWRTRNGAEPSGWVFTNMDGTLINRLASRYVAKRAGTYVERMESLGDDSVVLYGTEVLPQDEATYLAELGLRANPDKQFRSVDACHFLQRWHSLRRMVEGKAVGVRPFFRAFSSMLSFERFREPQSERNPDGWSKWHTAARLVSQMQNCKNHPFFEMWVLFIKRGDRYLHAGYDVIEIIRRAGGVENVRRLQDIASFPFNAADPSGAEQWEVTQILRAHKNDRVEALF